jgi:ubiquinone/menaquinone biosynthesis C-methylase UbiE
VHEYDLIADWYASQRGDQTGIPEVEALASSIPSGSYVLDIGCGNGIPITRALLNAGHEVVGLDCSSAMLDRFRINCPGVHAVLDTIQNCPFPDSVFDAAVAWGVMFHLKPDDQITAIANVSRILKRNAPFLFTSGDIDGLEPKEDKMNGVTFRYYSFSIENYREILERHALTLVDVHQDAGKNTYYMAIKDK